MKVVTLWWINAGEVLTKSRFAGATSGQVCSVGVSLEMGRGAGIRKD